MEISDESLEFDKIRKLPLYAKAGIQEAWLINLPQNLVEIYTNPSDEVYQAVKLFRLGETIKSEIIPNFEIEVDKILG
jgi:Uma2 family endonuclease